jgi:hypothetical protein
MQKIVSRKGVGEITYRTGEGEENPYTIKRSAVHKGFMLAWSEMGADFL